MEESTCDYSTRPGWNFRTFYFRYDAEESKFYEAPADDESGTLGFLASVNVFQIAQMSHTSNVCHGTLFYLSDSQEASLRLSLFNDNSEMVFKIEISFSKCNEGIISRFDSLRQLIYERLCRNYNERDIGRFIGMISQNWKKERDPGPSVVIDESDDSDDSDDDIVIENPLSSSSSSSSSSLHVESQSQMNSSLSSQGQSNSSLSSSFSQSILGSQSQSEAMSPPPSPPPPPSSHSTNGANNTILKRDDCYNDDDNNNNININIKRPNSPKMSFNDNYKKKLNMNRQQQQRNYNYESNNQQQNYNYGGNIKQNYNYGSNDRQQDYRCEVNEKNNNNNDCPDDDDDDDDDNNCNCDQSSEKENEPDYKKAKSMFMNGCDMNGDEEFKRSLNPDATKEQYKCQQEYGYPTFPYYWSIFVQNNLPRWNLNEVMAYFLEYYRGSNRDELLFYVQSLCERVPLIENTELLWEALFSQVCFRYNIRDQNQINYLWNLFLSRGIVITNDFMVTCNIFLSSLMPPNSTQR